MTTQTNDKTPKDSARESMQKSLAKSKGSGTMKALNSDDFSAIFNFYKPQIAQALPKHLTPERIIQQAITIVSRVPELKECTPESFIGAIMQASILGFQPVNALGQCYFIPYKNSKIEKKEVQFQIGYRGMLDLARRSGEIQTVYAQVVYENDEFTFEFGLNPTLKHVPALGERGALKYVYAVVKFNNSGYAFEVMSKTDVEQIRKRSKSGNSGPWVTDYPEMARKTVLRRVLKYCPLSVDVLSKVQSDGGTIRPEDFHSGSGDLNLDGISFADFDTVTEESEPPEEKPETQTETEQPPTEQPKSGLFPEGSKK